MLKKCSMYIRELSDFSLKMKLQYYLLCKKRFAHVYKNANSVSYPYCVVGEDVTSSGIGIYILSVKRKNIKNTSSHL